MSEQTPKPTSEQKIDQDRIELETQVEGVRVVETDFHDPELLDMIERNKVEVGISGGTRLPEIEKMKPRTHDRAYRVTHEDEDSGVAQTVGGVYIFKQGVDTGMVEIAYFKDKHAPKGVMWPAVEAVTEETRKSFEIMAKVDKSNERSARLLKGLGTYAYFGASDQSPEIDEYFASKKR